jgi:hypothetical protein
MLAVETIVKELYKYLHEALPSMSTERMVDLLEFIAIQNAGIAEMVPGVGQTICSPCFTSHSARLLLVWQDNTVRRPDIAACCRERPFVISGEGINSLANLVSHGPFNHKLLRRAACSDPCLQRVLPTVPGSCVLYRSDTPRRHVPSRAIRLLTLSSLSSIGLGR